MPQYLTKRCLTWLGALCLCLCAGCSQVAQTLEAAFPDEQVKPEYKLPKEKTVLVFPDDLTNPVSYPPLKRELAEQINEHFRTNKLAEMIPYQRLADLQANDPNFNRMSVATVGRKLGADLVIYINIEQFSLKEDEEGTIWHPDLEGRVRLVDVQSAKRLWPDESAGYPFKTGLPIIDSAAPTMGAEVTRALAKKTSTEISYLFHEHTEHRSRPKEKETELDH